MNFSILAAVLGLPLVESRAADPVLAADVDRLCPGLLLAQNPDDLLCRELLSKQATEGQNRPIKKAAN